MAADIVALLIDLLRRAREQGTTVKNTPEGTLIEVEQDGESWLLDEDGMVWCAKCEHAPEHCDC